jgi:Flp pilus assembly protein TadG
MVEFAIASTIFISMLLGIVEFGLASWQKNSVAADAREGARYAMVHGSQSGNIADSAAIANYVKSKTSLENTIIVKTTWTPDNKPTSRVTVKVLHAVPRRGPFLAAHTDSASSTVVILY